MSSACNASRWLPSDSSRKHSVIPGQSAMCDELRFFVATMTQCASARASSTRPAYAATAARTVIGMMRTSSPPSCSARSTASAASAAASASWPRHTWLIARNPAMAIMSLSAPRSIQISRAAVSSRCACSSRPVHDSAVACTNGARKMIGTSRELS